MKVAIIYPDLSFRGGERLFIDLANGLKRKHYDVIFIPGRIQKITYKKYKYDFIYKPSHKINYFFQNDFIFTVFSIPFTFFRIIKHIYKTDLIYTSESFLSLWPSVFAAKIFNKKTILAVFELGGKSESQLKLNSLPRLFFTYINTFFVKNVNAAVSINTSLVKSIQKQYSIRSTYFIPAGIDLNNFSKANPKSVKQKFKLGNKRVIIMPGIIHPAKKQIFALDILFELKKIFPNVLLMFIGTGKNQNIKILKKEIKNKELQNDVIITGYVKETELKNYYAAADLTLMCGPIAGLTIIESLFVGVMPIYPTSGKIPQGPSEPFNLGLIMLEYNSKKFAKKIYDYFTNHNKYKKKLLNDKRFVTKNFSVEKYIDQLIEIINK